MLAETSAGTVADLSQQWSVTAWSYSYVNWFMVLAAKVKANIYIYFRKKWVYIMIWIYIISPLLIFACLWMDHSRSWTLSFSLWVLSSSGYSMIPHFIFVLFLWMAWSLTFYICHFRNAVVLIQPLHRSVIIKQLNLLFNVVCLTLLNYGLWENEPIPVQLEFFHCSVRTEKNITIVL